MKSRHFLASVKRKTRHSFIHRAVADQGFPRGGAPTPEGCSDLLLPPANEVCEGYVFTPVSHSVHRRGRGIPACLAGVQADHTQGRGWRVWLGGYSGPDPGGSLGPRLGRRGCIQACTEADTPPQQTATAVGGTHPTGIHSYFAEFLLKPHEIERIRTESLACTSPGSNATY